MPVRSGVTVVTTLGCLFLSAPRLRVHRAPGIPCALYSRRRQRSRKTSGKSCRGIAESYLNNRRHCEEQSDEAIHTSFAATWIASLALAMTPQHAPHPPPSSPAKAGDPVFQRRMMESRSRSVLDTPLEPVIGLTEGETRWQGMTTL